MIESELGQIHGKGQPRSFARVQRLWLIGVIALHEDAAGEVASTGDAIDPRDRVFDMGTRLGESDKLVDADELDALVLNLAAHYRAQTNLRPGNQPGESHATNGRGVPVPILCRATEQRAPVGSD